MSDDKKIVDRLLGEVSYTGDVYKNALHVAYTLANRAKATGVSLESVTSLQSQVNAQSPAPGAEKHRATVQKALDDAVSGAVPDPTGGATYYATPATFKNLPSGLSKTTTYGGHTFATDPQNRPIKTADGVKQVSSLNVPTPTARPITNTAGIDEGEFESPVSQARRTMDNALGVQKDGSNPFGVSYGQSVPASQLFSVLDYENPAPGRGYPAAAASMENQTPESIMAAVRSFDALGIDPTINSGFREGPKSPVQPTGVDYNAIVDGASSSRHQQGDAFDIKTTGMSDAERAALVDVMASQGFTGFGIGPNIVHADQRPSSADWDYGNAVPQAIQDVLDKRNVGSGGAVNRYPSPFVEHPTPTPRPSTDALGLEEVEGPSFTKQQTKTPSFDWSMPDDLIQAASRARDAFDLPSRDLTAPSVTNMLPATRQSGSALGASPTLTGAARTFKDPFESAPTLSRPESKPSYVSSGPTSRPNNSPTYGPDQARDVISSSRDSQGDAAPGTNTSAMFTPSVSPMASQRKSVQQYADQVSYVDVPNPDYKPGVPSQEIIDQMMNLPTDWNPAFPEPVAQAVPKTIRKKVVTRVPSGYKTYSAPKVTQPTLTREQEQTYGKSGYASGQTWRDTGDGGARNFSPTTSNYRNYGGSSAGSKSKNQSTGKGGSLSTIRAIANKVKSDFGGGSSSSGGGKIVCTAMNEAYGFGGFRNAIWLRYAREHLTPSHQTGYHVLFRPLVAFAYHAPDATGVSRKARSWVRASLEHIARERTADLWAEMRGSPRRPLGRAYRSVLEPVCYLVGQFW